MDPWDSRRWSKESEVRIDDWASWGFEFIGGFGFWGTVIQALIFLRGGGGGHGRWGGLTV